MSKSKRMSPVWKHFTVQEDGRILCKLYVTLCITYLKKLLCYVKKNFKDLDILLIILTGHSDTNNRDMFQPYQLYMIVITVSYTKKKTNHISL